ncbi:MAG: protein kinase [Planctomycetes bacterium]|nr:protein kinase [Planctomycetota bacterium]
MNERIEELVAEFVRRRDDGEDLDAEDFAAAHKDLAVELRRALVALGAAESAMPDRGALPPRIGEWTVDAELGRGGMGRVLAAHRGERRAAIKLLGAGLLAGPRGVERLRREGDALLKFAHEHVVRVLEIGSLDGAPWIAMELVDGPSLAERIAAARANVRAIPPELGLSGDGTLAQRAARLVAKLARAVHAAHEAGLLHRDLKPANVLLRGDGSPVLIDFGLAADDSAATLTHSGDVLGTPNYMAPEQARGQRADRRTDVRGLGVILLELLTLEPPFPQDDALALLTRVRREPVRLHRSITGPLRRVLARAVAFEPRDRHATAAQLADELDAVAAGRRVAIASLPARARVADFVRSHRVATRVALGAVAVACAVGAVLFAAAGTGNGERVRELRAAIADAWLRDDRTALDGALASLRELDAGHRVVVALREIEGTDPPSPELADLVVGARALATGDPAAALPALERVATTAPDEPLVLVMLARAAEKAERAERAAEAFSAAIHLMPRSAAARRALASVFRGAERLVEAEALLVDATDLAPESSESWTQLCDVRLRKRDGEGALAAAERAMATAGREPSRFLRATYAAALDATSRWDEAHAVYRALLEEKPDDVGLTYAYAYSLDRAHAMAEARLMYERVSAKRPKSATIHIAIAWLVSGAATADCAQCVAYYAAHGELLDPDEAVRRAVLGIECDRGASSRILDTAVNLARHLDRRDEVRAAMSAQLESAHLETDDPRILALTKALRRLDEPR